ncbi:putative uncharacterized protein DDB_G0286901 [Sipha flava]|uniref:Uncharacterized protein n=1 Tax=Sipha flava TaxID=143950 RepID=A0A8B8GDV5_9HEMI|nr:putative uncharacterized protein DDB_G0286901 [Sipha flava]
MKNSMESLESSESPESSKSFELSQSPESSEYKASNGSNESNQIVSPKKSGKLKDNILNPGNNQRNNNNLQDKKNVRKSSSVSFENSNTNGNIFGNNYLFGNSNLPVNSNTFTTNGRTFVNNGEYEIFYGGDRILKTSTGIYTGLKGWKKLSEKEKLSVQKKIAGFNKTMGNLMVSTLSPEYEESDVSSGWGWLGWLFKNFRLFRYFNGNNYQKNTKNYGIANADNSYIGTYGNVNF